MLLVFIPMFLFVHWFNSMLKKLLLKIRLLKQPDYCDEDWNIVKVVDEKLGEYWQCLTGLDQKRWFTKEIYQRNKLKISQLEDSSISILRHVKRGQKYISNIPCYDMLWNPL